nr:MAG TPA: hypothetical protein [Caudoviricetes sp.]
MCARSRKLRPKCKQVPFFHVFREEKRHLFYAHSLLYMAVYA